MRRSVLIPLSLLCLLFAACEPSPEEKVKQQEAKNAALEESSGYNECMRQVKADEGKVEACVTAKLAAAGYTDGIDCIEKYDDPACKTTARYNAQVEANNTCPDEIERETTLYEGDCNQMLMEASIGR